MATSRSSASLNRTHLPFVTSGHVHHFVLALHWSISISLLDLLGGGHRLCTAGCRASPRHERRLQDLVSFRDIRPLSLYHSVCDLNSLRDLLDGRHPFLYCRCISLNCTCVVSTAFWRLHSWSVHHSVELPEPESEASLLFAVGLGLPELVRLSTVSSTSFSMNWTCSICAVF